jgi:hypothetical protein
MGEIWSKLYIGIHVKYSLFLSDFNETSILFRQFYFPKKYSQMSIFLKTRPEGAELLNADRRTYGQKRRINGIRNFANAPKNDITALLYRMFPYIRNRTAFRKVPTLHPFVLLATATRG